MIRKVRAVSSTPAGGRPGMRPCAVDIVTRDRNALADELLAELRAGTRFAPHEVVPSGER